MQTHQDFTGIIKTDLNCFHRVVPYQKEDKLLLMNFTESNKELTSEVLSNTVKFTEYVDGILSAANAKYGVGGYDEHRTIYKRSVVFDTQEDEPRRLHLGIDIWGDAYTPVYAPLEGTIHSFAFNDAYGDYGATLILQHEIDGVIFHTLYGHLSLKSIEDVKEGQAVEKGQFIASFGELEENGNWPPHLHFQIIIDMQGMKGDYPGVCKFSEREFYLANCPNPDLILNMMKDATAPL